jgi:hypothetical protein
MGDNNYISFMIMPDHRGFLQRDEKNAGVPVDAIVDAIFDNIPDLPIQ